MRSGNDARSGEPVDGLGITRTRHDPKFRQGLERWLGMESYLLDHGADNRRRLVVFSGPIFSDVDPVYRGVDIPLRYFKVAVLHRVRGP